MKLEFVFFHRILMKSKHLLSCLNTRKLLVFLIPSLVIGVDVLGVVFNINVGNSYRSHIRDVAKKQAVYGVQFNYFLGPAEPSIFASVGGNRVCVYECMTNGTIKLLQCYGDPDVSITSTAIVKLSNVHVRFSRISTDERRFLYNLLDPNAVGRIDFVDFGGCR